MTRFFATLLVLTIGCTVLGETALGNAVRADIGVCDDAQTAIDIVQCLEREHKASDRRLQAVYDDLIDRLKAVEEWSTDEALVAEPPSVSKLRQAERLWIQYRDANCDWYYQRADGGSIAPVEKLSCLLRMTEERLAELRDVRNYIAELGYGGPLQPDHAPVESQASENRALDLDEEKFVEAFAANCVSNMTNFDKIRAAARMLDWKTVPPDVHVMGAPAEADSFESWSMAFRGERFLIGLSSGRIDDKRASVCAVMHPDIDGDSAVRILLDQYEMRPIGDDVEGFQRYRAYLAEVSTQGPVFITLMTAEDASVRGATLSAMILRP